MVTELSIVIPALNEADYLPRFEAKRDIGRQRNQAAAQAQYSYLLFLDADVLLSPRFLEQLTAKTRITKPFHVRA